MSLPANIVLEKNKIATENPFIILIKLTLPTSEVFYLTNNNEDVVFDGNTYTSLPIELDATRQTLKGEIPSLTLKLSNITRLLRSYIESSNGCIGSTVLISVVNTAYLSEDYTELTLAYDVVGLSLDSLWVYMVLGPPNPLRRRFPLYRYLANRCRYVAYFDNVNGGAECKYIGPQTTCTGTQSDCRYNKGNIKNYGGFPGTGSGAYRVA